MTCKQLSWVENVFTVPQQVIARLIPAAVWWPAQQLPSWCLAAVDLLVFWGAQRWCWYWFGWFPSHYSLKKAVSPHTPVLVNVHIYFYITSGPIYSLVKLFQSSLRLSKQHPFSDIIDKTTNKMYVKSQSMCRSLAMQLQGQKLKYTGGVYWQHGDMGGTRSWFILPCEHRSWPQTWAAPSPR